MIGGTRPPNGDGAVFPAAFLATGFRTTVLATGFRTTGLATAFRTTGLGADFRRTPFNGCPVTGLSMIGTGALPEKGEAVFLATGFQTTVLETGFRATGLATGFRTTVLETGFRATGLATGFRTAFLITLFGAAFFTTGFLATFFTGFFATFLATGFLAVDGFEPKRAESGCDAFAAGFPTGFLTAFFGLLLPPPLNIAGHTAGCCCTAIARRGAVAAICQADAVATQATKTATSRIVRGRMLS